ncbi:MAG: hypothetical protein ACYTEQ_08600 [Planctomycetota bacterium]
MKTKRLSFAAAVAALTIETILITGCATDPNAGHLYGRTHSRKKNKLDNLPRALAACTRPAL